MSWIPNSLRQLAAYSIVGVFNTATDFLIFSLCLSVLQINVLLANLIAFAIAVTQGYLLNTKWTFRESATPWSLRSYLFFVAINMGGLVVSSITIVLLSNWTGPLLAKLASVIFVLFWGFLMARRFVFSRSVEEKGTSSQALHDSHPARLVS